MCRFCDLESNQDYLDGRMDMLVMVAETQSQNVDELLSRYESMKACYKSVRRAYGAMEERVYRLELVLDVMCHQLGIKLPEPLNAAGNRPMGPFSHHDGTNVARRGQILATPRDGSQRQGHAEESRTRLEGTRGQNLTTGQFTQDIPPSGPTGGSAA